MQAIGGGVSKVHFRFICAHTPEKQLFSLHATTDIATVPLAAEAFKAFDLLQLDANVQCKEAMEAHLPAKWHGITAEVHEKVELNRVAAPVMTFRISRALVYPFPLSEQAAKEPKRRGRPAKVLGVVLSPAPLQFHAFMRSVQVKTRLPASTKAVAALKSHKKVYKTSEADRVYSGAYHRTRSALKGKLSGQALKGCGSSGETEDVSGLGSSDVLPSQLVAVSVAFHRLEANCDAALQPIQKRVALCPAGIFMAHSIYSLTFLTRFRLHAVMLGKQQST
eukprot:6442321-Amphidinium_carterae.2